MKKNRFVIEVIFLLLWTLELTTHTIFVLSELVFTYENMYTKGEMIKRGIIVCLVFLTAAEFLIHLMERDWKILLRILMIAAVSYFIIVVKRATGPLTFATTYAFAVAWDHLEFRKFVKVDVIVRSLLTGTLIFLCVIGVLNNYTDTINGNLKQAFGFGHPNALGIYVSIILMELVYLMYEDLKIWHYAVYLLVIGALFWVGTSRTAIIIMIISLAEIWLFKCRVFLKLMKSVIMQACMSLVPVFVTMLCYGSSILYVRDHPILEKINQLFTTRIFWANYYLENMGIPMFGQHLSAVGKRTMIENDLDYCNSLDMGYVRLSVQFGFFLCLAFIILMVCMQYRIVQAQNWPMLIISNFFILLGITESYIYICEANILLLIMFQPACGNRIELSYQKTNKKSIGEVNVGNE